MPLIVPAEVYDTWLAPQPGVADDLRDMLIPATVGMQAGPGKRRGQQRAQPKGRYPTEVINPMVRETASDAATERPTVEQILIESLHQGTLEAHRAGLDESRVRYYMAHPEQIAGVLVYQNPADGERIPVNGHHRLEAARRLGRTRIDADLRAGTRQDALLYRDLAVRRPWSDIERDTPPPNR